jgi:predicted nucleic acid-binding Zn ribbon protein
VRRRTPRPLSDALGALQHTLAPATLLAEVQRVWPGVAGEAIAREASPTAERGGVVTVTCAASVWAHELDLMAPLLIERINAAVRTGEVKRLRCVTTTRGRRPGAR